jgi:hypothetical protein
MKQLRQHASESSDQTARAATDVPHDGVDRSRISEILPLRYNPIRDKQLLQGRILDVDDVAAIFKCCTEKVKRMARSGELPAFKWGGRWYVRENDLEQMVERAVNSTGHLRRVQEAA